MDIEVAAAVASGIGALGAFFAAFVLFWMQKRRDQAYQVVRLHDLWWSEKYRDARALTFKYVAEFEAAGGTITPIIKSYREGSGDLNEDKKQIALICFFFADLNALIDERIISERVSFRFFGSAHYFWFSSFLLAVANEIELHRQKEIFDKIRWIPEVRELDARFSKRLKGAERKWQ